MSDLATRLERFSVTDINDLKLALDGMVSHEWGTTKQLEAEVKVFSVTRDELGIDWESHSYLDKATTEEAAGYIRKVLGL